MGKIRPIAKKVSFFVYTCYWQQLTAEQIRRWISAISREDFTDSILENDQDCNERIVSGEPAKDWYHSNVDWLPTLCLGHFKQQVQVKDPEAAEVLS